MVYMTLNEQCLTLVDPVPNTTYNVRDGSGTLNLTQLQLWSTCNSRDKQKPTIGNLHLLFDVTFSYSSKRFSNNNNYHISDNHQGRVAIVVAPWIDPFFMERSLTQHFGQQERSICFWIGLKRRSTRASHVTKIDY